MADKTVDTQLTTVPDPSQVAAYINQVATDARDVLNRAWVAVEAGQREMVQDALVAIDEKVRELQAFGEQSAQIINGLVAMSEELTGQRDAAITEYKRLESDMEEMIDESVAEQIDHLLGCEDCRNDVEVEWLANRIDEEGFEELAEEQRQQLEARLKSARETHEHWHAYEAGPAMGQADDELPAPFIVNDEPDDDPDEDPDDIVA